MEVKLKKVRLAFSANLFTPGKMAGDDKGEAAYSCTFLINKEDEQVGKVKDVINTVAKEKWGVNWEKTLKGLYAENKVCFKDGETKSQYDGFEECMFIPARSKIAPLVIDRDKSVLDGSNGKPYAGCYVNAKVDIWAMQNNYGRRICCTLKGVQFDSDGDAFAGSAPASEKDFDDLSTDDSFAD